MTEVGVNAEEMNVWEKASADPDLAPLLRKASMKELYALSRHIRRPLEEAILGLIDDPHGCVFCDYGVLRNPSKTHRDGCPYAVARSLVPRVAAK